MRIHRAVVVGVPGVLMSGAIWMVGSRALSGKWVNEPDHFSTDTLLAAADAALYQGKTDGRNRVAYASGDGNHDTHRGAPNERL